jgi:acetyl coenzyme A synthetase (ADP forming)-like protein
MPISTAIPSSVEFQPIDYPATWEEDAVLKDGHTVRIRPIVPADSEALQAFVNNMSTEASYFRFFRVKRELTERELAAFTDVDYHSEMAFVAIFEGSLVGVGRYSQVESAMDQAEVAFTVADDMQGRGVGTLLVFRIAAYARERAITEFKAFVLSDNHAMMRVFRNAGFKLIREIDEGVYTVTIPTEESDAVREAEGEAERMATAASLMPLFYPTSIAVIGASRNKASIGGRLFNNILNSNFTGPLYPINVRTPVVRSIPAFKSVIDIEAPVDLAFVVVPAAHVLDAVRECAEKGVRAVCVISAGFSETGEAGSAAEDELLEIVRSGGMRMVGPNCMGLLNTDTAISLNGQFGPIFPPKGNVAMSSQSGALGLAILDYATDLNIGISSFVSVGNKADISGNDLLLFWEDDPNTDVILLYLESFGNPRRFSRIARRIGRHKPIVAVKSGRTAAGARAASSHTGSLASLDVAVDALFAQAGVVRVTTLEDLFDVTTLLANQPIPQGRRVGIVTNAGGPAILAVDALESQGLEVPQFSEAFQQHLRTFLSGDAAVANPVDMIAAAGPEEYRRTLTAMLESDEVDSVIAVYIPASTAGVPETAAAITQAAEAAPANKTFLSVYMNSSGIPTELGSGKNRFPTFSFPERAAKALRKAVEYAEWLNKPVGSLVSFDDVDKPTAHSVMEEALTGVDEAVWLEPEAVDKVLGAYGIQVPKATVVHRVGEAIAFAAKLGGPVVLKVVSPSAVHKTDVGGVALDLSTPKEIKAGFAQVMAAVPDPEGVLVQEFVSGGHEVLIGMFEDPNFGPLIGFGLGGVFVELIGDVAFKIHPLSDLDARDLISEVKSGKLLEGYRGSEPADIEAVVDTLLRVSALVENHPEVVEMDLNPVKVAKHGEGIRVVDARIRVRPVAGRWIPSRSDQPMRL